MKKFLKTVFFGFVLCFFKILTPYLMVLGKYLVSCKCQAIVKKFLCQRFFVLKSIKVTGELFFDF